VTKKTNNILLVLLVIQAAFVFNAYWVNRSHIEQTDAALFEGLGPGTVSALSFVSETESGLELKREDDGIWAIAEEGGYPADAEKVEKFIEKLQKLDRRMVVASTKSAHRRLKVAEDKFNRKVKIKQTGSGQEDVLYIGTAPSQGQLHIRTRGDDRVYLTRVLSAWEAGSDSTSWLDRNYVEISGSRILAVELENSNGRFSFEKVDDGKWDMDGLNPDETVDSSALDILVNRLVTVRMQDVLGQTEEPTYGLENPALKAVISYRPEESTGQDTLTLVVGPKDDAKANHVAKSSKSRFFVTVPAYAVREPIEAIRDSYISRGSP